MKEKQKRGKIQLSFKVEPRIFFGLHMMASFLIT